VLYNMVAGELPFRGPHAASILDKTRIPILNREISRSYLESTV